MLVACGEGGDVGQSSEVAASKEQAVQVDCTRTESDQRDFPDLSVSSQTPDIRYSIARRCSAWAAFEVVAAQHGNVPADHLAFRQQQQDVYNEMLRSSASELGRDGSAEVAQMPAVSECRISEYRNDNSKYDLDAQYCTLDWQQRLISGLVAPPPASSP
jgi:hypothetical protein